MTGRRGRNGAQMSRVQRKVHPHNWVGSVCIDCGMQSFMAGAKHPCEALHHKMTASSKAKRDAQEVKP